MSLGPNRMSHTTINHTIIAPPFPTKRSWRTVGLDLPVQKTGEANHRRTLHRAFSLPAACPNFMKMRKLSALLSVYGPLG